MKSNPQNNTPQDSMKSDAAPTNAKPPTESVSTTSPPPADSAPFTWGDFRKFILATQETEEGKLTLSRAVISTVREVERLKATCRAMQSEIECMQLSEGYEKRRAEAEEATAANTAELVSAVREHGRVGSLAILSAGNKATPQQQADMDRAWAATVKGTDHVTNG
jgi:hypothetical protein